MAIKKLKLSFKDDKNNSKMLTIDYPKETYNPEEIKTAMDKIVESNVIQTKEALITNKAKAYEETVDKKEYSLA